MHHAHANAQMANPAFARLVATVKTLKAEHAGAEVVVSPPTAPTLEPEAVNSRCCEEPTPDTAGRKHLHCAKVYSLLGARIKVRPIEASAVTARAWLYLPTTQRQCPADISSNRMGTSVPVLQAAGCGKPAKSRRGCWTRLFLGRVCASRSLVRVPTLRLASLGAFVTATDRKAMLGLRNAMLR